MIKLNVYLQPLLIWCAVLTGTSLALAAWLVGVSTGGTAIAIAAAIAADSAGLQPAPYAILADMFHYQVCKRQPQLLLIWCAVLTGASLALAAWLVGVSTGGTAIAIAAAIASDSAGLQPAPHADMFHNQVCKRQSPAAADLVLAVVPLPGIYSYVECRISPSHCGPL